MSAEQRSKCAALLRQWWRLHMREKFSSGTKIPKQTIHWTYLEITSQNLHIKQWLWFYLTTILFNQICLHTVTRCILLQVLPSFCVKGFAKHFSIIYLILKHLHQFDLYRSIVKKTKKHIISIAKNSSIVIAKMYRSSHF